MLLEAAFQVARIEKSFDVRMNGEHLVTEHRRGRAGNPFADGRGKAAFWQFPQTSRQPTTSELSEERLAGTALLLLRCRNPERQFDHAAVEQRATDFEAVSHAHAIHLDERIVRQIDLQIGITGALHGVA